MRFQSKILLSVFCLVLMSFVFMSTGQSANAQDWCCNNNSAMGGDGQCVLAPNGAQNCSGAALTFFEDGVNGIVLAPLGPPPNFPQSGDLCPNPAPRRDTCMCIDGNGATVPCQDLPPPPTNPPPTNPPPTNPPPTDPPPTNPPPTNPPPTDPPPTNPPPTPTPPPVSIDGCCVEAVGLCAITEESACAVPPNIEFMGIGTTCGKVPMCEPVPTPTPTPPPFTTSGCCVEDPGVCRVVESSNACPVPPYFDYVADVSSCENVDVCNLPPPVTSVPTMNQWGLIATAVMLGLFSLITVRRGFRIKNKENN